MQAATTQSPDLYEALTFRWWVSLNFMNRDNRVEIQTTISVEAALQGGK
jgi:hypothetical protein